MIKIDKEKVIFKGSTRVLAIECMMFFKSFNDLVESGKIKTDDVCACDINEIQKLGSNILDGIKTLEKDGFIDFLNFLNGDK